MTTHKVNKEIGPDQARAILLAAAKDFIVDFKSPSNLVLFISEAIRWQDNFKFKDPKNNYNWHLSLMLEHIVPAWYEDDIDKIADAIEELRRLSDYIGFFCAVQGILTTFAASFDFYSFDDFETQRYSDCVRAMIKLTKPILEIDLMKRVNAA